MQIFLSKKVMIAGVLCGVLSVGVARSAMPDLRKLPAGSPLKKGAADKNRVDMAKSTIAQVEKLAQSMRDATVKDAMIAVGRALRALDYKIDRAQTKMMKRRRKKTFGKNSGDRAKRAAAKKEEAKVAPKAS